MMAQSTCPSLNNSIGYVIQRSSIVSGSGLGLVTASGLETDSIAIRFVPNGFVNNVFDV